MTTQHDQHVETLSDWVLVLQRSSSRLTYAFSACPPFTHVEMILIDDWLQYAYIKHRPEFLRKEQAAHPYDSTHHSFISHQVQHRQARRTYHRSYGALTCSATQSRPPGQPLAGWPRSCCAARVLADGNLESKAIYNRHSFIVSWTARTGNGRQWKLITLILPAQPKPACEHHHPLRSPADSMDRRTNGKVQSHIVTRFGVLDTCP